MPEAAIYRNCVIGINGTLVLRSIQQRKNEVCTIFRSGAMDVYNADVRESRSLETGVYVQLIQVLPVTP